MSLPAVRSALETALAAMSPALATAFQNVPYEPVQGTPWQAVTLLPGAPFNPEMGTFTTEAGMLQVSLFYPLGAGPGAAEARAQLIRATFKRGTALTAAGVVTTVEATPEIAPAMTEDAWLHLPVRIRFFANYTA